MSFIRELEIVLPFIEELDEHRQRCIATFAAHMVEGKERDDTMTVEEIERLRELNFEKTKAWIAALREQIRKL